MKLINVTSLIILSIFFLSCNSTIPTNVKKSETQKIIKIDYGNIISSVPVEIKGEGSEIGAVAGAMAGGLLATQVCGDELIAGTPCQDIAILYGTIGGAALGYATEAKLGNHNGFQYVIDVDETENDIALVQGDISPLKNGQRIVILYSDTVRVLPFDG